MSRNFSTPVNIGNVFGSWTVIGFGQRQSEIKCRCKCGQERIISRWRLVNNKNRSCFACCGSTISNNKTTHGNAKRNQQTHEYIVWGSIMRRCYNQQVERYPNYGGRGISVCERWHEFSNFLSDMGTCPSSNHTIGRKDNNGNYEPNNCRWATQKEQMNNTRRTKKVTFCGETLTLSGWAERLNVCSATLYHRLFWRKWTVERAFTQPIKLRRKSIMRPLT